MAKLYVFGIGGTGSRVLTALTMLLASGVDTYGHEIVPIFIDPDCSNGNLTKSISLLDEYVSIREKLHFTEGNKNKFFSTKIEKILQNFTLPIEKTSDLRFQEFIDLPGMKDKANQAMARMLFSDENLTSDMNVGFKGNPNIGSVVLNQIAKSDGFISFAQSFQPGDKIFIISSIFGGTGASGFPLLLKTMRTDKTLPNSAAISTAQIGAVSVLPYFKVKKSETSSIDSASFISKAKSALSYYERNIAKSQQINALYFIGDDDCNTYDNNEGGYEQDNQAHALELLASTAILDFARTEYTPNDHYFKELGLKKSDGAITLNSLFEGLDNMIKIPMTQFALTALAQQHDASFQHTKRLSKNTDLGLNDHFYSSIFISQITSFLGKYKDWLNEMKNNKVSLNFYDMENKADPFNFITDVKAKKKLWGSYDWDTYRAALNKAKVSSSVLEDAFMEMYYSGTLALCTDKFNL